MWRAACLDLARTPQPAGRGSAVLAHCQTETKVSVGRGGGRRNCFSLKGYGKGLFSLRSSSLHGG